MFNRFKKELKLDGVFTGFVVGPPRFAKDEVRYVLDQSPAAKVIKVGDKILAVNGTRYFGEANFFGTAGKLVDVEIERAKKIMHVRFRPSNREDYGGYVDAIAYSMKKTKIDGYTIGYVHDWCGGQPAHDQLEGLLCDDLQDTDGLILDLRDGYGGNSLDDLDVFFRPPEAYPSFKSKTRDGKIAFDHHFYNKPVVALINDGSRSGKEMLAYTLKKTGRARLVGMNTAGAFLGGKLIPIDQHTALYLAVIDAWVDDVHLEGKGVAPDVVVEDHCSADGKAEQLARAQTELIELLKKQNNQPH
jgi:carboxyl-terminal processing protease